MIIVILGAAGSGKTTLRNNLISKDNRLVKNIGYTSRKPKKEETNGVDYHFVDKNYFDNNSDIILRRDILNEHYGVSKEALRKQDLILILDPNGIKELEKSTKLPISIIHLNFSKKILIQRMLKRGDSLKDIHNRLSADNYILNCKETFNSPIIKISDGNEEAVCDNSLKFINSQKQKYTNILKRLEGLKKSKN